MTNANFIRANFEISEEAKRGIAIARSAFNAHSSDKAAVVSIGWAIVTPDRGSQFGTATVSFYGSSQLSDVVDLIQNVSGVDLVFFTTPSYARRFDGKTLNFADDRGFFLR